MVNVERVTPSGIEIVELTADQTYPLRRTVLRDGTLSDEVAFEGDDRPSTFHLGASVGSGIVAIATWMQRRYPDLPAHAGHQLRGMATATAARRSGVGALLLAAGLQRCADSGSTVVWARARLTALPFYERHGFEPRGDEYIDPTTGLPHRDIVIFI